MNGEYIICYDHIFSDEEKSAFLLFERTKIKTKEYLKSINSFKQKLLDGRVEYYEKIVNTTKKSTYLTGGEVERFTQRMDKAIFVADAFRKRRRYEEFIHASLPTPDHNDLSKLQREYSDHISSRKDGEEIMQEMYEFLSTIYVYGSSFAIITQK